MPLVIRFIKSYLNWEILPEESQWLQKEEIPADPLSGLQTKRNTLSVYLINDDKSKLERCVSAFAVTKSSIQEVNYILFEEMYIQEAGIKYIQSDGELIDKEINNLHFNLSEISSQKLVKLAKLIINNDFEADEYDIIQVKQFIQNSLSNNWMAYDSLNNGIRRGLK